MQWFKSKRWTALAGFFVLFGCFTPGEGQRPTPITEPVIALPVAIANHILHNGDATLIKGEIGQDQNCMRPYPISRLKVVLYAVGTNVKEDQREKMFYPSEWVFEKRLDLDQNSRYRIQLIYEPNNTVLFEKKINISNPLELFLKINCPQ